MISAEGLCHRYGRGAPIFRNVAVTVAGGELVALTGGSGRGKSTLLFILGLMLRPTSGAVIVDGQDFSRASDTRRAAARANHFGFVFQDAALDPSRSVLDNVVEVGLYSSRKTPEELERSAFRLLREFGVAHRVSAKPGQISGGQAQRIALCRALVHDPEVLIADEPTGNLDALSKESVLRELRRKADAGGSVVVATHDPVVVALADRVVTL